MPSDKKIEGILMPMPVAFKHDGAIDHSATDAIIDFYLAKYNSLEPLAKPPNTGFNRMAWLFPYLLGAGGAVAIGFVAVRWSRRRDDLQSGEAPAGAADPALEDRLDDELRNLD